MSLSTAPGRMTLGRHIIECQIQHPQATGELSVLLTQLAYAGKIFAAELRRAALVGGLGLTGDVNVQGEATKKLDVFGNRTIIEAFAQTRLVAAIVSEEEDEPRLMACGSHAKYLLAVDPLDGSSNSDVNGVVGTIFGIYRLPGTHDCGTSALALPATGHEQVAAGYIMYGPSTVLVYTTGHGLDGFTLDHDIGEFVLTHPQIICPTEGRYYSVNLAGARDWPARTEAYISSLNDPARRHHEYSQRYAGAFVADMHRTLIEGGIYFYPADARHPDGKLRLLYECAPLAFVVEQAAGAATTGTQRILDVSITTVHQRAPLAIGSRADVERYERFLETGEHVGARP